MCKTEKNVEFLIDNEIDLHGLDEHKKTPLIYAFESKGNHNVIKAILEDITKSERDAKEDHKKMAVHFAA